MRFLACSGYHATLFSIVSSASARSVVVVDAVAGRGVDDARAVVERDVVGVDELALDALVTKDRLLVLVVAELLARHVPRLTIRAADELGLAVAELLAVTRNKRLGHELGGAIVLDGDVGGLRVQDDGVVRGKGPRGGRRA